ncbi:MAG: D-alanine--D-alanine ligase A, partial [Alicyclobacillus sp. RIFOXYA1_FULL_53_8]
MPTNFGQELDVIVPVLHGSNGEDGTIQGLLEVLDLPYVGAGVLASAVGMDKVFMKTVFGAAGLPQVQYTHFTRRQWEHDEEGILTRVEAEIPYPCFVKPANLGSSVGISKAKDRAQLRAAIQLATRFDRKVIVEEGLKVREIEVAVLGNDEPQASVPGEVVPSAEFYDYRAKYIDGESALFIPADLTVEQADEIRRLAVEAFLSLECTGLARVDFFIDTDSNRVLVNEINTMPGFTDISMYPKLWEATGLPYSELIDRLIDLALQRHAEKSKNVTD